MCVSIICTEAKKCISRCRMELRHWTHPPEKQQVSFKNWLSFWVFLCSFHTSCWHNMKTQKMNFKFIIVHQIQIWTYISTISVTFRVQPSASPWTPFRKVRKSALLSNYFTINWVMSLSTVTSILPCLWVWPFRAAKHFNSQPGHMRLSTK